MMTILTQSPRRMRPEEDETHPSGKCFETMFHLLVNGFWKDIDMFPSFYAGEPKLVHGIVYHEETSWNTHAWIEDSLFCYDFIDKAIVNIPKHRYYYLGKVKIGDGEIFRYTKDQAIDKAINSGKYYFSNLPCDK